MTKTCMLSYELEFYENLMNSDVFFLISVLVKLVYPHI